MAQVAPWKKRWLWIVLLFAIWTFMGLLSGVETYIGQLKFDKAISWGLALRRSFKDWYSYAILSLGIIWFCGRNRLEPGRTVRWLLSHFGAAVIFSMAYITLS